MIGLHVTVPIACFRKGMAREYLETEPLPSPATCYGFLLSLVGEVDRHRHIGCRVTAGLAAGTNTSVVLRTVWRVKKTPLGSSGNMRPDYQQLLTGASSQHPFIELLIWLESADEAGIEPTLEARVRTALDPAARHMISRFGGLSLGESTHMVDSVSLVANAVDQKRVGGTVHLFEQQKQGRLSLPIWVDHVGSRGTRYAVGSLVERPAADAPALELLPIISPD